MLKHVAVLSLLLAGVGAAGAQEFWLEPSRFFVAPGAVVHLRRLVGSDFHGQPWPGRSNRVAGLVHYAPGAPPANLLPLATAADTLATTLTLRQQGTHLIALTTTNAFTTLPALEFTAYLQAAGLEYALAQRQQRGEAEKPGREAYRRCAKTLVHVGPLYPPDTARAWGRVVGHPLELVPEQNPARLAAGSGLTVRVLAEGRPVAGQLVRVWWRAATTPALLGTFRSNQNGRVLFRISGPGEYLVGSVRMTAAPAGQQAAQPVDWQSAWASLTFGVSGQKRL